MQCPQLIFVGDFLVTILKVQQLILIQTCSKKNVSLVQNFIVTVSVFVYLNQCIKLRKESEIY